MPEKVPEKVPHEYPGKGATRISEFVEAGKGATRISEFVEATTTSGPLGLVIVLFSVMIESSLVKSEGRLGWRFAILSNRPCSRRSYAEAMESLEKILRFEKTVFAIRLAEQTKRWVAANRQGIQ